MSRLRVQESIEIGRPVTDVYSYVANVNNLSDWAGPVIDVQNPPAGTATTGDTFVLVQKFLGRRFEAPCKVTEAEPDRQYTYQSTGGPIPYTFSWTCEEAPSGTRLTQTAEGEPGSFFTLVGPLFEKAAQRQVKHDLQTLKDLLEHQTPS